ncbi:MAG TPA: hypothetical protein VFV89_06315 [Nocardioides sp.]|nr:hypothetical protein [Nocardioides sp.]HEX5087404.1 hypothetical protein [Nocardioides sp.]
MVGTPGGHCGCIAASIAASVTGADNRAAAGLFAMRHGPLPATPG